MKAKIKVIWKDFIHYLKTKEYNWKFKLIVILPLFFTLLFVDILSKTLCNKYLEVGKDVNFMPGFINIRLVYNKGSAFGLNADNPAFVVTCSIILSFFLLLSIIFLSKKLPLIGLTMMFTGALGNLIDRTYNLQGVIDFFDWQLFKPYSIFNFADICVVFGIVEVVSSIFYILIKEFVMERKESQKIEKNKNEDSFKKEKDSDESTNGTN